MCNSYSPVAYQQPPVYPGMPGRQMPTVAVIVNKGQPQYPGGIFGQPQYAQPYPQQPQYPCGGGWVNQLPLPGQVQYAQPQYTQPYPQQPQLLFGALIFGQGAYAN